MGTHRQQFPRKMGHFDLFACNLYIATAILLLRLPLLHVSDPISFSALFKTLCQFRMHFNLFFLLLLLVLSFHFVPSAMMQFTFNNCETNSNAMAVLEKKNCKNRKRTHRQRKRKRESEYFTTRFYLYIRVIQIDDGKFQSLISLRTQARMNLILNFDAKIQFLFLQNMKEEQMRKKTLPECVCMHCSIIISV